MTHSGDGCIKHQAMLCINKAVPLESPGVATGDLFLLSAGSIRQSASVGRRTILTSRQLPKSGARCTEHSDCLAAPILSRLPGAPSRDNGGGPGERLRHLTEIAATGDPFGGQSPHHRTRAVQLLELRIRQISV